MEQKKGKKGKNTKIDKSIIQVMTSMERDNVDLAFASIVHSLHSVE